MLKKTVRIQLFDKEGMISDRLVTANTEFYAGPREFHQGPMRIEFTFLNQTDVEKGIKYLKELTGLLPKESKTETRGRKSNAIDNDSYIVEDKQKIFEEVFDKSKDQDVMIKILRDMGYIFVTSDHLKLIIPEGYEIKDLHLEKYEWLIKLTKEAKDPKLDKFDPQTLVGISISKKRLEKFVVYLYGKFHNRYTMPLPSKKAITFKKTNLIKFPHYMQEEERLKWNTEHRALFQNKEKKPSKFYMRWRPDVQVGDELKISDEEILARMS
jgi:hypothetical protein